MLVKHVPAHKHRVILLTASASSESSISMQVRLICAVMGSLICYRPSKKTIGLTGPFGSSPAAPITMKVCP